MADRDKLQSMLDNLINDKSEQAQVDFHDFLQGKMKEVVGGEEPEDMAGDTRDSNEE